MDRIEKALKKLSAKEREEIKKIFAKLKGGDLTGFDLKKLKGKDGIFRTRKGDLRIIFRRTDTVFNVLAVERGRKRTLSVF